MQRIQKLSYLLLAASFLLSIQMSWTNTANFSITPNLDYTTLAPDFSGQSSSGVVKDERLRESFALLSSTAYGSRLADALIEKNVVLEFGQPRTQGMAAVYIPAAFPVIATGRIVISYDYKDAGANMLAALVAHEAVHAQHDTFFGEDTVEQEYLAYMAQAAVWQELRHTVEIPAPYYSVLIHETSPENDFAVRISQMSRDAAYELIYTSYLSLGVELPYN